MNTGEIGECSLTERSGRIAPGWSAIRKPSTLGEVNLRDEDRWKDALLGKANLDQVNVVSIITQFSFALLSLDK